MVLMLWLYLTTNGIINMQNSGTIFVYICFFYLVVDIFLFIAIIGKISDKNTKDE